METLLISPASRGEIVLGKFLTVMLASVLTAVLNLVSMGLTMTLVARQVAGDGPANPKLMELQPPPLASIGWMLLLLIPLSGFFSALCLSLAVMARSMKEGQYYMTPLYMLALPLMFLTLMPGVELSPFFSLVPITGVALLLKSLMAGQYEIAATYFLPVLITTIAYGALALKWAVDQFQSEGVLFREAERFDLRSYITHLIRDKQPLPTTGAAVMCFAMMVLLAWYTSLLMGGAHPLRALVIGHAVFILGPPLAMAMLLTSSPKATLRLYWPGLRYVVLGALLAVALHPLVGELRPFVERIFPISKALESLLQGMFSGVPLPLALLLFAVMPAITEEVAFRGFILSGLQGSHKVGSAVVISAVLFGLLHVLISLNQQFFNATILGLVLGWLAIKSRSLYPGVVMHATNNGLAVALGYVLGDPAGKSAVGWLFRDPGTGLYAWPVVVAAAVASAGLLYVLYRLPIRPGEKTTADSKSDLAGVPY